MKERKKGVSLLRIGELAGQAGEEVSTIRYWTNEGLLKTVKRSKSGYRFYDKNVLDTVNKIQQLQKQRLTLEEIKTRLRKDR